MRTLHSFATICVFGAALAALGTAACSSSDEPTPGGAAGSSAGGSSAGGSSAGGAASAGDPAKGSAVWTKQGCDACHGPTGAGSLGPNITFSKTAGIGDWTLAQFTAAVRNGKDTDGTDLCLQMTRFTTTDIDDPSMANLYAYLKSLTVSDKPEPGTFCPN